MPGAGNSYLFGAHGMTIWFFVAVLVVRTSVSLIHFVFMSHWLTLATCGMILYCSLYFIEYK